MRERSFLISIGLFFFLSASWLAWQQNSLLEEGREDLVIMSFQEPENPSDFRFSVRHGSKDARTMSVVYRYPNNQETEFSLTLGPQEEKLLEPDGQPETIILRYQGKDGTPEEIFLTKK